MRRHQVGVRASAIVRRLLCAARSSHIPTGAEAKRRAGVSTSSMWFRMIGARPENLDLPISARPSRARASHASRRRRIRPCRTARGRDHEDDVVRHQVEHGGKVAGLAGRHPRFDKVSDLPLRRSHARLLSAAARLLTTDLMLRRRSDSRRSSFLFSGDASLGESRHAVVAGDGRLDDADRERRARAFAEPHAEIEQRRLAEPLRALRGARASAETWPARQWSSAVASSACRMAAAEQRRSRRARPACGASARRGSRRPWRRSPARRAARRTSSGSPR